MIRAWFDAERYIREQPAEAAAIMAKVVGMKSDDYRVFLPGTRFFDAAANRAALDAAQPVSLQAVAPTIAAFLHDNKLLDGKPDAARGVDATLLAEALK